MITMTAAAMQKMTPPREGLSGPPIASAAEPVSALLPVIGAAVALVAAVAAVYMFKKRPFPVNLAVGGGHGDAEASR